MFEDEPILTFKRQIGLIALGALIGFVPAFMNTLLQSRFQRKDIFLARRLALVQGLSSINEKAASALVRAVDLQTTIDSVADGSPSLGEERNIVRQERALEQDSVAVSADLRSQLIVFGALYHQHMDLPGYEWELTPFSSTRPKGGELAKLHDSVERDKAKLVNTMRRTQKISEDVADSVNR